MNEELRMQIATFRFGVISEFVTGQKFEWGEKRRLLEEKSTRTWVIPGSPKTRISKATILLWIQLYQHGNRKLEALAPQPRSDKGTFRAIPPDLQLAVRSLKETKPELPLPALLQKLDKNIVKNSNRSTLYRFIETSCAQKGNSNSNVDRRRFEAEFPNQLWQCDVLHGPLVKMPSGPMKKSYLIAIIDDHSRLIVHAQFYLSENLLALKDCLRQAVQKRGLPQKFYVDNGACYRAENLEQCLALLGVGLAHSRPYVPEGRGKIERWFGYVRQSFLPVHGDRPRPLSELNERLDEWVDRYNSAIHGTTKMPPYDRFRANMTCVRPAPSNLIDFFRHIERRVVKKDRTVQLNGIIYEVPIGLIDRTVELRFHETEPENIEVFFENRSYGTAIKLNAVLNSKLGREGMDETSAKTENSEIKNNKKEIPVSSGKLFGDSNKWNTDSSLL